MSNKASKRKPLIVGIIAAVAILAALLGVLLTQCTPGGGGASTPETTAAKPVIENADLYWNVDRALYDGMSEGGMSSRRPESDGYFHVRFFKDGEFMELKVENRTIVNKLEVRDLMGLVFDDNGVVTDVIPIEDMPVQKIGWKFYVQSVGGHIIKVNSSNKFDGMEVLLDTKNGAKIYDMTGTMGAVGMETDAAINDRIMAVTDLEGELLAVYIYDRSNMQVEFQAYCQHCDKEATWIEWKNEKQLPKQEGHFQLVTDVKLNGQQSIQADMKICLDLNGHTVDGKEGSRVYSVHSLNSELAIMDTSEEQTGKLAAHGEIYAQGCVVWVRSGNCYMYGGTLDASDAVCTGRGGAAVYVAADRYFYLYGGEIIGGTAKYHYNEDNASYANGLGGSVYNIGKFVMKDGVIRDGYAEPIAVWENGKTSYKRGLGGNIYVGSGGEFVMDGGSIQNGRAGSSGNIYLDGTAEFTMNGGSISGGVALNPGREGGNLNMGAKATFTMNGGSITYGTSHNNVGNVYCAGTFVMNSGYIAGGRAVDAQTGKVKENAPTANLFVSNGGKLYMYGGTVQGQMAAVDSSTKDGKHTTIVLAGMPVIYADGAPGLTLQTGAEPVQLHVYDLHDLAKIGIHASGKFSLETKEANRDNFISNIEGAEVLYVDKCLGLGKLACLCGSEAHFGRCDGKKLLWGPWTSKTSLPNTTGNYFLADDVSLTGNRSVGSSEKTDVVLSLDLNGKRIVSAQRVLTVYATLNLTDHVGGGRVVGAGLKNGKDHTGNMLMVAGSQLNVYGGTIALADDHYDLTSGGVMGIGNGAEVNLYGGVIDGRSADAENKIGNGGAVRLSGVLNVQGGEIYGGTANRGGTIYVEKTGVLNIFGGKIHGGTAEENGGALYVAGGKVTMSGGTITGGSGVEGGNIRIQASGQFDMTGGVIEKGTSSKAGGNVSLLSGQFNLRGGEVRSGIGSNGGNFVVASTLNISGGAVSGGKTSGNGYGGNIHTTNEAAVVNISGGTVTGGFAGNRGGNISGIGTLNISGGTVSAGNANNGGGNIESTLGATAVLNISGGVISGGLYKNEANTDRSNLYVTTGKLNISGSVVIDGGILLVNNAKTTISGEPQIIGEKFGIKLAGVNMAAPVITVGDLGGNAKIGLNHEGVFGVEGEAADTSKFIPADASFLVHHDAEDNTLYVGHVHCLCGNGEASWCDHKAVRWSKWDGKSSISEGNYYLASSVENTANVSVGTKDKTLNICLGGNTISTTNSRTLNINGNVSIFDHSETPGALIGTGGAPKVTEKDGVTTTAYEHSAVAVVAKDARLNLYNGTLKLAENHNQLSDMGGVMAVANGGEFHMYGGCVDASASLTSEKTIAGGGAIRVDGKVNIQGGTILGGKVTGNGGAILLRTATAEVNISGGTVSGGTANAGGAIHVAGGVLNITGGTVENGISATKGGNINQVKGSVSISDKALIQNGRANQGGNLAVTPADGETVCQLSVSGGQIKGGTCSNAKGNDANLYVNNTVLKLSGGEIDGGVSVVNTSGTKAYVEMSGDPKINKSGAVNLRLVKIGGTQPVVKIMGQLTGEPGSVGITGTLGVVATAGGSYTVTETDKAYFTSDDPAYRLRLNAADVELYVPHLHCWCENADTVPADHTCDDAREWTGVSATSSLNSGYYYVTETKAFSITVKKNQTVYLDLNGKQIRAQDVIKLEENATLYICDCSEGKTGEITTTKNSVIKLEEGQTVRLLSGTVNGTYRSMSTNPATSSRIAVEMSGGNFYMYGGKLTGGCAYVSEITDETKKETETGKGGSLYMTGGTATILGGQISGGKLDDVACDVVLKDGQLTVGGDVTIGNVLLAEGETLKVSAENALATTASIGISVEKAPEIGQSTVVVTGAANADAFVSVDTKLELTYENNEISIQVKTSNFENKSLKYDDRKELKTWLGLGSAPTSVTISNQVVKSTQVDGQTPDKNVLVYENGVLYAVGTGTAVLTVDDVSYNVTVEPAKLSLFMITGSSIGVGQEGDASKSVAVEAGQAYSTYAVNNHNWSATELDEVLDTNGGLGFGSATRADDTLDAFAPGQGGTKGEGSALAWSWLQKTGEKVWILNTAKGGSAIIDWIPSSYNSGYTEKYDCHDHAVLIFSEAQDILAAEIAAGHYTLGDMAIIYHNGHNFSTSNGLRDANGPTYTSAQLADWYDAMWNSYQSNFNKDLDGDGVVDTIKMGFAHYDKSRNTDQPISYYLAATNSSMSMLSNIVGTWEADLSTFPAPNYPVQDGSTVTAPDSVYCVYAGGTSDNSLYCIRTDKVDKTHLSQVGYNALGLDIAENLYGALRTDRAVSSVEIQNANKTAVDSVLISEGNIWPYSVVTSPLYGGNLTIEASGAISLNADAPWEVVADEVGTGKLTVKNGSTVLAEVEFTVNDGHRHCFCVGAEVTPANHTCDSTVRWTPVEKEFTSKTNLVDGGHYFLNWSGETSAQSLIVADNATVYICLNGATIYATQALTIGDGATVHICDCSEGESGMISVSGGATTPVINLTSGKSATVNFYSGNISGTGNGKSLQCVLMEDAGQVFNMYGGTIADGVASDDGGNIMITAGSMNIYGGIVEDGVAGAEGQGGNIYVGGEGSLTVSGGQISNGHARQGGNIGVVTAAIEITGGTFTGGTATQNSNNANFYVNNSVLKISGGTIDGGVTVVNTSGTQAWVELSGNPRIMATDNTNLRLAKVNGDLPVIKIVGKLIGEAESIGITMASVGVFAKPGNGYSITESDMAVFVSDNPAELVGFAGTDLQTYKPHTHCWCENADSIPAGHVCASNQEWTAIEKSGNAFSIDEGGCYYLNWTGSTAKSITVNTTDPVHLCLNGAQISAMNTVTLREGSNLTICDCGTTGRIGVSGGATRSPILLDKNTAVSLYSGTVTGCLNSKRLAAVTVSNDSAVFNMYGGKVFCSQGTDLSGGNMVLTAGTANILGGTVEGGTEADSYGITVSGGQLTLGGDVDIDSVKLADGKTITVKDGLTTTAPISIAMEKAGIFAVAETGKSLSYEGKKSFASADAALNVACYTEGYALTAAPVGCLCGKTDGTHEDYCTKLDPVAWTGTGLPTETGNYYLTAPVAVEAATTVAADRHIKLWLQGNDITVAEGKTISNIFIVEAGASLALADTTGENAGTIYGLYTNPGDDTKVGKITQRIINSKGALIIDGANLSASGLTIAQDGLAVRAEAGSVLLKSGTITGGKADGKLGGAVYVTSNATMNMLGGTITGGTANYGGNLATRGDVTITGGSITNGAYTSRGGNVYAQDGGSISISGSTTNISGGYSSTDSTKALKDRSNVVAWNADVTLTDVTLEGGVWVTGNRTCTLSGNVVVNGDGVGLTLGATSNGGPTARVVVGEDFETTSTVDLAIAVWAKKVGNIYASGLTEAQVNVFTIHTADVTKRQETGKDTWEIIVHP